MPVFKVRVSRTETRSTETVVEAEDAKTAELKALEKCKDLSFLWEATWCAPSFGVLHVEEVGRIREGDTVQCNVSGTSHTVAVVCPHRDILVHGKKVQRLWPVDYTLVKSCTDEEWLASLRECMKYKQADLRRQMASVKLAKLSPHAGEGTLA
jgi:hypothetical protein